MLILVFTLFRKTRQWTKTHSLYPMYFWNFKHFSIQGEEDIFVESIDNYYLTGRSMKNDEPRRSSCIGNHHFLWNINNGVVISEKVKKEKKVKCLEKEKHRQIKTNPFRFELFVSCFQNEGWHICRSLWCSCFLKKGYDRKLQSKTCHATLFNNLNTSHKHDRCLLLVVTCQKNSWSVLQLNLNILITWVFLVIFYYVYIFW